MTMRDRVVMAVMVGIGLGVAACAADRQRGAAGCDPDTAVCKPRPNPLFGAPPFLVPRPVPPSR